MGNQVHSAKPSELARQSARLDAVSSRFERQRHRFSHAPLGAEALRRARGGRAALVGFFRDPARRAVSAYHYQRDYQLPVTMHFTTFYK